MNQTNEPTKAVVKQEKQPTTLKDLLSTEKLKMAVASALPKHLKPERFIRIAITALTRNPKLQRCTQESFFQCLLDLSALGLEPDGRRAYLIPYEDNRSQTVICQLQLDYKGIVELVRRSGEVSNIHADVVCENDTFDYMFGSGGFLRHKPAIANRGKVTCCYSFVRMKDGSEDFDVMNVEDVEAIRKRSRSSRNGPWVTDWNEMAKKTIFRRQSKWLPLSPELREMIEKEDEPLTETERFAQAKTVNASEVTFSAPELPAPSEAEVIPSTEQAAQPELVNA
jgi:recombination protein RecT